FPAGKPFVFSNWQTPHEMQEGEWDAKDAGPAAVTFGKRMSIVNYAGTRFDVDVERKVSILSADDAKGALGLPVPEAVKWVGFATSNTITNRGSTAWTEAGGLVSVWILGMFAPVPGTEVVVPFETKASGPIVNDRYFGKVPTDRLTVREAEGFLRLK